MELDERLERLKILRARHAPRWVIKAAQINLVLAREGLKPEAIGLKPSKRAWELLARHVHPLLE